MKHLIPIPMLVGSMLAAAATAQAPTPFPDRWQQVAKALGRTVHLDRATVLPTFTGAIYWERHTHDLPEADRTKIVIYEMELKCEAMEMKLLSVTRLDVRGEVIFKFRLPVNQGRVTIDPGSYRAFIHWLLCTDNKFNPLSPG